MNWKRHLAEAGTLVAAAVFCALVANALASRERKLALPGSYPDATKVPVLATAAPAPEPAVPPSSAPAPVPEPSAATVKPVATPVAKAPVVVRATPAAAAAAAAKPTAAPERLTDRFPPHPDKPWVEVPGADVAYLHGRGVLVLDARRTSVYGEGHIAGALSFPVWESDVDRRIEGLVGEARDPKQPIVIYCSGGDCEDSHMLAQKLFGAGFQNLLVYRDGWPDWVKRGGAARTGQTP